MIFAEASFLGSVGLLLGNVLGYALNAWWQHNPIALTSNAAAYESYGFEPMLYSMPDIAQQAIWSAVVLGLTFIVALWPAVVAMKFRPVEAIRQA